MKIRSLAAVAAIAVAPMPHAHQAPLPPPPTPRIVALVLASSLAHHEQTAGTHYRFYDEQCQTLIAGKRWACTVRARSKPGHLVLFGAVTYTPHVGFDFGKGLLL